MAEVGYLIGAGASADCVPVVNGMANNANEILIQLDKILMGTHGFEIANYSGIERNLIRIQNKRILEKIFNICDNHSSIDTYAKKLYISRDKTKYYELKNDLSYYFTLVQILKKPDKRYDNFWASILSNSKPPSKVSIFSWNYDFQFEKSYMEFGGTKSLNTTWSMLGICSPNYPMDRNGEENFNFTKLNGSARFNNKNNMNGSYFCEFTSDEINKNLGNLFKIYFSMYDKYGEYNNELNFAWEEDKSNVLLKSIRPVLQKINVLVIIGYSFPFFNRKIDERLFEGMTSLNRIIIQDPDAHNIHERLKEFLPSSIDKIELRGDKVQFVFPKELDI